MKNHKAILIFFVCLVFSIRIYGQAMPGRPAFIGLYVKNVETTAKWYEEKLGFRVLQQRKISDQLGFAMLEGYGLWIEVIQNPKTISRNQITSALGNANQIEGFFKIGIFTNELDSLEQLFKSRGVKFRYEKMKNDNFAMTLFIIEDPEGNWIQFYNTPQQKF
jgi:catechol 2,3-dioxygenase-like lactoylglutathione lyase family enzyme